ncbi:MAG TPA: glycosyltransferase family 4 protein [Candidatus Sulfotelmatobacter sp.]|nr:glycosyltransferase family 4 protein [Candidatus Sulfotelmatobacter sp.]
MTKRLVIITEIISPYRIPLFNVLAQRPGLDLHVIFLAETDPVLRQWNVHKQDIRFKYEVLSSWRMRFGGFNVLMNRGLSRAVNDGGTGAILCGGYNYLASWEALIWSRLHKIPFLLWSESNLHELRSDRSSLKLLKSEFLRHCDAFVVPGLSAREYLRSYDVADSSIFTAHNAVDNELFSAGSSQARQNADEIRRELALPGRYFLFVGRFVKEKGVFDLLSAYAKLDARLREQIGLIFVGDGVARRDLERQAQAVSPGVIRFAGFRQQDELSKFYALADVLILPTYTDSWGLVVNEAMACGLPVILSKTAGCAADLVTQDWNGLLVDYSDSESLAAALSRLAEDQALCMEMGERSKQRISGFSPVHWADGVCAAVENFLRTE